MDGLLTKYKKGETQRKGERNWERKMLKNIIRFCWKNLRVQ